MNLIEFSNSNGLLVSVIFKPIFGHIDLVKLTSLLFSFKDATSKNLFLEASLVLVKTCRKMAKMKWLNLSRLICGEHLNSKEKEVTEA